MFERIVYISDHSANVKLVDGYNVTMNLMNLHIIFEDNMKKILGEVDDLDGNLVKVRFLGEIVNGKLLGGVIRKPSLDAKIRVIEQNEIPMICGTDAQGYLRLGVSPFYNDYPVFLIISSVTILRFLLTLVLVRVVVFHDYFKICFMIRDYFHIKQI